MRICAISDIHGHLPQIPECNVLLIAGDISLAFEEDEVVAKWWANEFRAWLHALQERQIVVIGIAGNHDFIMEAQNRWFVDRLNLPWIYLEDEGIELGGVKFWGIPWQPWFQDWAFNAPQYDPNEIFLREKYRMIPSDTDVIISHGPPAGFHDKVGRNHIGSKAFNDCLQRIEPTLAVAGHVHHGFGVTHVETGTDDKIVTIANVSQTAVVKGQYVPANSPVCFDI